MPTVRNAHLVPQLTDVRRISMVPIRSGYGEGLLEAARRDDRIVALSADLTESTKMNLFADAFPERFIQVGVAEQNLATVAAGMAIYGKIPFITSYAMFSPGRNWEQIRTTICYNNVPVKIVGSHAGVSVGPDGATHQALEDISLMRVLPNMTVLSPGDAVEARRATLAAATLPGPVYIRLAREKTPVFTTTRTPFVIGKASMLWDAAGTVDIAIIATGSLVYQSLLAAVRLEHLGYGVRVLNMHTIKPLDERSVLAAARAAGAVVSVEEHQQAGGLGSAVAELLVRRFPVPQEFVGVADRFGESGTPDELVAAFGLDARAIVRAAKRAMQRKK